MALNYENNRTSKHTITFTGASGYGLTGVPFSWDDAPQAKSDEYIYEVFYRVTTPIVSSVTASDYILAGIEVDDIDCIFNSTTGIIDTLNSNAAGFKLNPDYTKATATRSLPFFAEGSHITAGTIEITLVYARNNGANDTPILTS